MPGELQDPTQLYPFHYEKRYEPGTQPFYSLPADLNQMLQDVAQQVLGYKLDRAGLQDLTEHLGNKGLLHRNWGDESVRSEVEKYLKKLQSAKKVARKWLT